jgi:hypothetical protein
MPGFFVIREGGKYQLNKKEQGAMPLYFRYIIIRGAKPV